jgi:hypothetical protein
MLTRELEDFRIGTLADSVNKHQCRLMLQKFKYISKHPDSMYDTPNMLLILTNILVVSRCRHTRTWTFYLRSEILYPQSSV